MHKFFKLFIIMIISVWSVSLINCGPDDENGTSTNTSPSISIQSITHSRDTITNYGNDSVSIYVSLTVSNLIVNSVKLNLSSLNLSSSVDLLDTGISNDNLSNDNIYSGEISAPNVSTGNYQYYITVNYSNNLKIYATNSLTVVGTQIPSISAITYPTAITNEGNIANITLTASDDDSLSNLSIDLSSMSLSNGIFTNTSGDNYSLAFAVSSGIGTKTLPITVIDNLGSYFTTNISINIYSKLDIIFANGLGYSDPYVKFWSTDNTVYIPKSNTTNLNGIVYDIFSTYIDKTGSYNILLQDGSGSVTDYEEVATLRGSIYRTTSLSETTETIFAATWNRATFSSLTSMTNLIAECPYNLTNIFADNYTLPGCSKIGADEYLFSLFEPNTTDVTVTGIFYSWNNPGYQLKYDYRSGYWWTTVSNTVSIGDNYKFVIDSSTWITDPYARAVNNQNGDNNSVVVNTNYTWSDSGWQIPDRKELVIYELQVEDFTRNDSTVTTAYQGTYTGMIDKVSYLVDLGVTAVEIMPIQEWSGGWYSWGYNNSVYFAPENSLSTNWEEPSSYHDLKAVIDTYHQNGIAVILDVVYNHTANDNNVLWSIDEYYYFDPAGTDWGNKTEWEHKMTEKYFMENMRYWMDEFHVDGFRLDATQFVDFHPLTNAIIQLYENGYSNQIYILEDFDAWHNARFQEYNQANGFSLFSSWGTPTKTQMWDMVNNANITGECTYYSKDSGWNFPTSVLNYFSSHDEGTLAGRHSASKAEVKTAAAHLMTMMGIPMVWMGDEIMRIHYGNYHPDGDGANIAEENNEIAWDTLLASHSDLYNYYSGIIKLRVAHESLHHNYQSPDNTTDDRFDWNTGWGDTPGLIGYTYKNFSGDNNFVIMANYASSSRSYDANFPNTGTWYLMCDGESATNATPGLETWTISTNTTNVTIPAEHAYIWMSDYVNP